MFKYSTSACYLAVYGLFGFCFQTSQANAQSNFDLLAPVASVHTQPDDGLPNYAMATATGDGQLKISKAVSITKSDPDEDPKLVKRDYIVAVPYLATSIINGETIVEEKVRVVKKTRTVPGNLKTTKQEVNELSDFEAHSYQLVDGSELTAEQASQFFVDRTPVLLLAEGETIHPFLKKILKPDTVIIVSKKKPAE